MTLAITLCFCRTDIPMETTCPASGILQLAAEIEAQDHHTVRVVLAVEYPEFRADLERELEGCDVLGISATSYNWYVSRELIAAARLIKPDVAIVLGGVHPTHLAEYCLASTDADIVVRGEAEITFPLLLDRLARGGGLGDVQGIAFKDEVGGIVVTPNRPLQTAGEISRLPVPAYHLIPPGVYGFAPIEGSRGCHFDCAFCGIVYRRGHRPLPAVRTQAVVRRLAALEDRFTERSLFFTDDSFGAAKAETCGQLEVLARTGYRLGVESRFQDLVHPALADIMDQHDFYLIQTGVEAGYRQGVEMVDKKFSFERVYRFADSVARRPIAKGIHFSMTMGLPWEREAHVLATINAGYELAARAGSPPPLLNNFNPLPGSRFMSDPEKYGLPQIGPEFWDDGNWFRPYLGFTGISNANRDFLAWYSGCRSAQHPSIPNAPLLNFPDGTLRTNVVWDTERNTLNV